MLPTPRRQLRRLLRSYSSFYQWLLPPLVSRNSWQRGEDYVAVSGLPSAVRRSTLPRAVLQNQRRVLLEGGTDQPDTIDNNASAGGGDDDTGVGVEKGVFICALGGLPLFLSEDSLSSLNGVTRRGWPGFSRPVHPDHLVREV